MGIGDYLWPFQRKFSEVPCAREASIAALLGGPGVGAVTYMITSKPKLTYTSIMYSGFAIFWIAFLSCRHQWSQQKKQADLIRQSYLAGKID